MGPVDRARLDHRHDHGPERGPDAGRQRDAHVGGTRRDERDDDGRERSLPLRRPAAVHLYGRGVDRGLLDRPAGGHRAHGRQDPQRRPRDGVGEHRGRHHRRGFAAHRRPQFDAADDGTQQRDPDGRAERPQHPECRPVGARRPLGERGGQATVGLRLARYGGPVLGRRRHHQQPGGGRERGRARLLLGRGRHRPRRRRIGRIRRLQRRDRQRDDEAGHERSERPGRPAACRQRLAVPEHERPRPAAQRQRPHGHGSPLRHRRTGAARQGVVLHLGQVPRAGLEGQRRPCQRPDLRGTPRRRQDQLDADAGEDPQRHARVQLPRPVLPGRGRGRSGRPRRDLQQRRDPVPVQLQLHGHAVPGHAARSEVRRLSPAPDRDARRRRHPRPLRRL